jgi:hypothetical protein
MKLEFEENPIAVFERLSSCQGLDGAVGARFCLLP